MQKGLAHGKVDLSNRTGHTSLVELDAVKWLFVINGDATAVYIDNDLTDGDVTGLNIR